MTHAARAAASTRHPSRRRRLVFALIPLAGLLLVAEVVIRLVRAPLHFGSFRDLRVDLMARNYPAELHPVLGYVPRANFASRDNHWGTQVSIDADGMRRNGDTPPPVGERVVAAVGDSFTFGDQVDDDASWPAQLERALGQPVKNGGVFGYSLTQAVLRAEAMLERFAVSTLVVSFIADDLTRCEFKKRYTLVPWFDLRGDDIVLQPVPATDDDAGDGGKRWKNFIGHSALVDAVLANTAPAWWYGNEKQIVVPHLVGKGKEIGKKLVERIAAVCRARDVRLLLVQQDKTPQPQALEVLRHAESVGVQTLDLATAYAALVAAGPGEHDGYFDGHMTRSGNRWVAEQIAAVLRSTR